MRLVICNEGRRTSFIAFFTLSDVMRPFWYRLSIKASFVAPLERQAMVRVDLRDRPSTAFDVEPPILVKLWLFVKWDMRSGAAIATFRARRVVASLLGTFGNMSLVRIRQRQ